MTIDPSILSPPASFYVPETIYGEVCIKTPCQVDIIDRDRLAYQPPSQRKSSLATCIPHGKGDHRFSYTQYAKVHGLNCSGVSMISNDGVPNLCGRCVPPPPLASSTAVGTSMGQENNNNNNNNFLTVPSPVKGDMDRDKTPPKNCYCNEKRKMRTYEEIKQDCERWAAEREQAIKEEQQEIAKNKKEMKIKTEVKVEECGMEGEVKEEKKDSSNFMQIIKEITTAIQNAGGSVSTADKGPMKEEKPKEPIVVPEIIVTPPTPTRSGSPEVGTMEVRQATQERQVVNGEVVNDSPVEVKKEPSEQPQVAQMFAWGGGGKMKQENATQGVRQITPSECGFCKSLADVRLQSALGKQG